MRFAMRSRPTHSTAPRPYFRPRVEWLEDRTVPAVFTVINTDDSSPGSLRWAINQINATVNGVDGNGVVIPHRIEFAIPATDPGHVYYRNDGVGGQLDLANVTATTAAADAAIGDIDPDCASSWWTIRPRAVLPALTRPTAIDGFSQDLAAGGSGAARRVELDGSQLPTGAGVYYGLHLLGGSSTVRGLVINRFVGAFTSAGINLGGAGGNTVQANFIGTDISGTRLAGKPPVSNLDAGVMSYGINVEGTGTSGRNLIGGPGGAGNVICGTTAGVVLRGSGTDNPLVGWNVVTGNTIGPAVTGALSYTDGTGTHLTGNAIGGGTLSYAHDDVISQNVISGNLVVGVVFGGGDSVVAQARGQLTGNTITHNGHAGVIAAIKSAGCMISGNTIAFNGVLGANPYPAAAGVWLFDLLGLGVPTGISVLGNSIHDNTGLGIDLGGSAPFPPYGLGTPGINPDGVTPNDSAGHSGPNHYQNFPVLQSAAVTGTTTAVAGTLTGQPGTYRVEFFANSQPGHPNAGDPNDPSRYGEGETFFGFKEVTIGADGTVFFIAADLAPVAGAAYLTATATRPATGDTSEFSAALPVPAAGGGITVLAPTQTAADAVVAAVNGLSAPAQPLMVTVDLGGGNFQGIAAGPPSNVTLVFQNGTFNGRSPALIVSSGAVVVRNSTLQNTTDAPTVLVAGGRLVVRNSVIQESTGYAQEAVLITGGTLDLGTPADPGGNTLNVNGPGTLVRNDTAAAVMAAGNDWTDNGAAAPPSGLVAGPVAWGAAVTVTIAGGSYTYAEGVSRPATGVSATGAGGAALTPVTVTYYYRDEDGNWHLTGNGGTNAPSDPGYYRAVANFAGNDDYQTATATADITIAYEVHTLTDLSKAFQAGRAIPIKIQLLDATGNNVSSSGIGLTAVRLERVNADGTRTQVALEDAGHANPSNLFRYDAALGGYVFNLSTKGLAAGEYDFTWTAGDDPTEHHIGFRLN